MTSDLPGEFYTDAWTLRRRFAALGILDQLARGEITSEVKRTSAPSPASQQPLGTLGQIVFYWRGELLVCVVHQYVLPDGRLGASGMPDPKWLRDGDRILKFHPNPPGEA
jgi:hypothetical protein